MSEKTLKFNNIKINKKKFHKSKEENNLPEENTYYTCIACIAFDSVIKMNKKNYPQVYLEECKYKVKKIHTPRFINIKLESDTESDSETDSKSNATTEN